MRIIIQTALKRGAEPGSISNQSTHKIVTADNYSCSP